MIYQGAGGGEKWSDEESVMDLSMIWVIFSGFEGGLGGLLGGEGI